MKYETELGLVKTGLSKQYELFMIIYVVLLMDSSDDLQERLEHTKPCSIA